MAPSIARYLAVSRAFHPLRASAPASKPFSTSAALLQRRKVFVPEDKSRRTRSVLEDDYELLESHMMIPADVNDSPSSGHLILQQQRILLQYMRLIEHEMPKLVAFRKPFIPPTDETPIIVRSMHYQGEFHPAIEKRVIVVPVDKLDLRDEKAVYKIKLLAGARWTPQPPKDAGVSGLEEWGNGYVKISCEDFPKAQQNLKWVSDTLDKLVVSANDASDTFADVPLDMRHIISKIRKEKKGDHSGGRAFQRPTIHDFPKEWLPQRPSA